MFCPKWGSQFAENEKCCQNCGYELPEGYEITPQIIKGKDAVAESPSKTTV